MRRGVRRVHGYAVMKIVHAGTFLAEGLRQLGHEVLPLRLDATQTLNEQVETVCADPDLVLIEVWGKTNMPLCIGAATHRLAAYCIDTPLNEFWLRHFLVLCDDIFVDQLSSVENLARDGLVAQWLPLCVSEDAFVAKREKEYFLTFVGRITKYRLKRQNLVRFLQSITDVHVVHGVSMLEMQHIFARSHIVLNENLFSGLTLRVFQALASGSLLFTEDGGCGVDAHFRDGEHLVTYTPETILPRLADIQKNPRKYENIARHGQETCRVQHTSVARARSLLDSLEAGLSRNLRVGAEARLLAEAQAKYLHCLRYGGGFADSMRVFAALSETGGQIAQEACHCLGSIWARRGNVARARALLEQGARQGGASGFLAAAKGAVTHLRAGDLRIAAAMVDAACAGVLSVCSDKPASFPGDADCTPHAVYLRIARALMDLGLLFDLGFQKSGVDLYPDSALEYILLAWNAGHSVEALDLAIDCAKQCGIEPETMPLLKEAVLEGLATDRHIVYMAELAVHYYDFALAKTALTSFRRAMRQ